ncbi:MAG: hypothetical protein H7Z37_12975 [Pyrinomonadaceae bacterium]|nr:hypothetical protein [Pyrinomonadaceae bacterium]
MRQIAAFCLALVFVEVLCPVLCQDFRVSNVQNAVSQNDELKFTSSQTKNPSTNVFNQLSSNDETHSLCDDECLCHATPIVSFYFLSSPQRFHSTFIRLGVSEPLIGETTPPFRPPRTA